MKTLKKTLCLVLAVVMVLGLCVMSASADLEYTDNDKITYKEAVDVMSGIGVLKGDERGFRPTDSINRAEAAKIIAYMMVGNSTQADALKANTDPFTDVPATHWAAGYISYCVNAGVINGMGDGTFAPSDPVTGLQFAKMLLCALGYNANDEYVNSDWTISVSKDALRLGMFDGNLAGATNSPATREECALYAFNTIHGTDDYNGIAKVSYSALLGGYISQGALISDAADASKGETFGDDFELGKNVEDEDAFGRMTGHNWFVKNRGNVITALYPDSGDLKATYHGKVTGADIASVLGKNFIDDVKPQNYEVWVNGVQSSATENPDGTWNLGAAEIQKSALKSSNKDALTYTTGAVIALDDGKIGNGTETLVYAGINEKNESWIRLVVVDTYLAKVTAVRKATSTKEAEVTVTLLEGVDDNNANQARNATLLPSDKTFATDKFAKNDYVLVNIDANGASDGRGKIKAMEAVTVVDSTISRYNRTSGLVTLTASGTDYVAAKNTATDEDLDATNNTAKVDKRVVNAKKHALYVDKYGYLVAIAEVEVSSDYVYAAHFDWITSHTGDFDNRVVGVKLYYADGTNKVVTLNTSAANGKTFASYGIYDDAEDLIDADPTGIYKLTMKDGKAVLDDATLTPEDDSSQVKKGISKLDDGLFADSKTVFFYVSVDKNGDFLPYDDSDFSVKPYVGINSVRVMKKNDATIHSYFADGEDAEAVLVKDGAEGETSDNVYIYYGDLEAVDNGNDKWTVTYQTYSEGEQKEIVVEYTSTEKKDEGVQAFEDAIGTFFTLTSKNAPTAEKLTEEDEHNNIVPKKLNKTFYDDKLELVYNTNEVTKYEFVPTDTADSPADANTGTRFAWSYDNTVVIDVTGNTDPDYVPINSGEQLLAAFEDDHATITLAVQYEDNTSYKAMVIYVTDVQ